MAIRIKLGVNVIQSKVGPGPIVEKEYRLLEDGSKRLLEDGYFRLLDAGIATTFGYRLIL